MPLVHFESAPGDRARTVTAPAPEGGRLLDLIDKAALHVELSCRSADCGSCLVEILEGDAELLPPSAEEVAVLERLRCPARLRLGCQAQMRPGTATLRLRSCKAPESHAVPFAPPK
jgi:ferredoxin